MDNLIYRYFWQETISHAISISPIIVSVQVEQPIVRIGITNTDITRAIIL